MENTPRRNDNPPPMTNMDPSFKIPGSITPEERTKLDYAAISNKSPDEVEAAPTRKSGTSKPKKLPKLEDPSSTAAPVNPLEPEPIRKGSDEDIEVATHPEFPGIEEAIEKQKKMNSQTPAEETPTPTLVKAPEGFEETPKAKEEPLPEIKTDHVGEAPLDNEIEIEPKPSDDAVAEGQTVEESVLVSDKPAGDDESNEPTEPVTEDNTPVENRPEDIAESVPVSNEIEISETPKPTKEETDDDPDDIEQQKKNVEGSFPETAFVEGITEEKAADEFIKNRENLEKSVPVRKTPKTFNSEELTEIVDYTTRHYRIYEGQKMTLHKPIDLSDQSKVQVVEFKEDSNFDMAKLRIDRNAKQGVRKVQVVCTQSGYSVCCLPMNSRELQNYGRDERSKVENSYGTNMAIAEAIYRKLTDFSCGAMSFEKFLDVTAFPDLETLVFGVYLATYPQFNNFNLSCTYKNCQKDFVIPIKSDTLVQVAPGNVTQQQIQDVLYSGKNPVDLIKDSKRYTGIRIFTENKTKMFIVRTPSINEFYERAYRGKRESIIQAYSEDMYFAGYIRSVGTLDIEKYNETGEIVYYQDDRIEAVDKAIADLSADDKEIFTRRMLDYINRYSVSYQIPRVRCPHCRRIMSQREVSPKSLFFAAKLQRGL